MTLYSNKIVQIGTRQTEEELRHYHNSTNYPAGVAERDRQYPRAKDPDTVSQTSFRSINERDYGRVPDTLENERLLLQVTFFV